MDHFKNSYNAAFCCSDSPETKNDGAPHLIWFRCLQQIIGPPFWFSLHCNFSNGWFNFENQYFVDDKDLRSFSFLTIFVLDPQYSISQLDTQTSFALNSNFNKVCKDNFNSDGTLYAWYRSMVAPYGWLQQVQNHLDRLFQNFFPFMYLQARGSVVSHTALRKTADLDLDLIIPYSMIHQDMIHFYEKRPEFFCEFVRILALMVNTAFPQSLSNTENNKNETRVVFNKQISDITRSMSLIVTLNGSEIEVDLFPKIVNNKGMICSARGNKSKRIWDDTQSALSEHLSRYTLHEPQIAAILIIKYWKWCTKQSSSETSKSAMEFRKGYHINLAMERILDLEHPPGTDLQTKKQYRSNVSFSRTEVSNIL